MEYLFERIHRLLERRTPGVVDLTLRKEQRYAHLFGILDHTPVHEVADGVHEAASAKLQPCRVDDMELLCRVLEHSRKKSLRLPFGMANRKRNILLILVINHFPLSLNARLGAVRTLPEDNVFVMSRF